MKRLRIDKKLVEMGLAPSRAKAQAFVMAGIVLVNEKRIDKASETVGESDVIRLKSDPAEAKYVGRGGLKMEAALEAFDIRVYGYVCLDVGSSTGGFTDCLLQNGAARVYAVDVGTNQLDWKLRSDDRVTVMENVNARYLEPGDFPERFDLIVMDVSFISVTKILKCLIPLLKTEGRIITLIKPQFEVGKGEVGKGGIVRDEEKRAEAVRGCIDFAENEGLKTLGVIDSPILGAEGNKEFLVLFEAR